MLPSGLSRNDNLLDGGDLAWSCEIQEDGPKAVLPEIYALTFVVFRTAFAIPS
jgi:hypothetical protein